MNDSPLVRDRLSPEGQRILALANQKIQEELRSVRTAVQRLGEHDIAKAKAEREQKEAVYQGQRAVAIMGDKVDLQVIRERLAIHPAFAFPSTDEVKISPELRLQAQSLVAQFSFSMGLNPFIHIHAWIDMVKGKPVLQICLDYKALLYKADLAGSQYEIRLLTKDEMLLNGVKEDDIAKGAIGAECLIYDIQKEAYCIASGVTYRPIKGQAIWYPEQEAFGKGGTKYTKREHVVAGRMPSFRAQIRALRAAFYQFSDLGFMNQNPGDGFVPTEDGFAAELPPDNSPDVVNGEWVEEPVGELEPTTTEPPADPGL